jgi:cell division septum initiation protein DivIVA
MAAHAYQISRKSTDRWCNDVKDFWDKNTALHKQIRELQHHIEEYDKKEVDPNGRTQETDRQTSQRLRLPRELRLTEG